MDSAFLLVSFPAPRLLIGQSLGDGNPVVSSGSDRLTKICKCQLWMIHHESSGGINSCTKYLLCTFQIYEWLSGTFVIETSYRLALNTHLNSRRKCKMCLMSKWLPIIVEWCHRNLQILDWIIDKSHLRPDKASKYLFARYPGCSLVSVDWRIQGLDALHVISE